MKPLQAAFAAVWHAPGRTWAAAVKAASITLWWRFGAVVMMTALVSWLIWIIWRGPWPAQAWEVRLELLGRISLSAMFIILVGVVALMDLKLNFSWSKDGLSSSMQGDQDPPPEGTTRVTNTTTVDVPAGAPAPVIENTAAEPPQGR